MKKRKAIKKTSVVLKNALEHAHIFYGLHMVEGIATYEPPGEKPFTVYIGEKPMKLMNQTFPGKPVYVGHVDDHVDLADADGVVSDSFYNRADGKHWCKFAITTQRGLDAINSGCVLSNCLRVSKKSDMGGRHHGQRFDFKVESGYFHHLALVPNPRYEESIILTPEQFKQYNQEKEQELLQLANSKEKSMKKFAFFKNEAVDEKATKAILQHKVHLPTKKKDVTIEQLLNEADVAEAPAGVMDQEVEVGGSKVKVRDLIAMYTTMKEEMDNIEFVDEESLSNEQDGGEGDKDESEELEEQDFDEEESEFGDEDDSEEADDDASDEDVSVSGAEGSKETKLENSMKKKAIKKPEGKKIVQKLKNAADKAPVRKPMIVNLQMDQFAAGKAKYGSKKK